MSEEKICFIISRIGTEDSEERLDADRKLKFVFTPILEKLGYIPIRADEEDSPGSISKKIVMRLINSPLVIVDITGNNPNVFYELAIRNAVGKPVIIVKEPSQKPPFDIQDIRCVSIDMTDPEIWQKAIASIEKLIKSAETEPDYASGSILSEFLKSFQLDSERKISNEERSIFEIQDLRAEIRELREELVTKTRPSITSTFVPRRKSRLILEILDKDEKGLDLRQLASATGLPTALISSLMLNLRQKKLVEVDKNKALRTYRITKNGKIFLSVPES